MPTKELTGAITLDLSRQPQGEIGDAARLALALSQITVEDDVSFRRASEIAQIAASRIKAVEDEFEADKDTAYRMHKSITGRIKRWTDPYKAIREKAEALMKPYIQALEATKAAQEENIKASGEDARQELLEQAKQARRRGDIKAARELEEQAEAIVTDVVLASNEPEVDGQQIRRPWMGQVDNVMELIVAIAEGRQPLLTTIEVKGEKKEVPFLIVNEQAITYWAKKLQDSMKIPGCKAVKDINFAMKRSGNG